MLVKFFRYCFYFITVTVLVSGCSGNKAPVFEENRINVNKRFQEKHYGKGIERNFYFNLFFKHEYFYKILAHNFYGIHFFFSYFFGIRTSRCSNIIKKVRCGQTGGYNYFRINICTARWGNHLSKVFL